MPVRARSNARPWTTHSARTSRQPLPQRRPISTVGFLASDPFERRSVAIAARRASSGVIQSRTRVAFSAGTQDEAAHREARRPRRAGRSRCGASAHGPSSSVEARVSPGRVASNARLPRSTTGRPRAVRARATTLSVPATSDRIPATRTAPRRSTVGTSVSRILPTVMSRFITRRSASSRTLVTGSVRPGAAPPTVKSAAAGVASGLPTSSSARTATLCGPAAERARKPG